MRSERYRKDALLGQARFAPQLQASRPDTKPDNRSLAVTGAGYGRQAIPYQEDDNVLWEANASLDREQFRLFQVISFVAPLLSELPCRRWHAVIDIAAALSPRLRYKP